MKLTTLLLLIALGGYGQHIFEVSGYGVHESLRYNPNNKTLSIFDSLNVDSVSVGSDDTLFFPIPETGGSTIYTPDWIFHGPLDDCRYNLCEHERTIRDLERRVKELESKF